jgi:cell wall-associated NlpC family hydrolase
VHSPKSGDMVRTEQMQMRYWKTRFDGARRLRR